MSSHNAFDLACGPAQTSCTPAQTASTASTTSSTSTASTASTTSTAANTASTAAGGPTTDTLQEDIVKHLRANEFLSTDDLATIRSLYDAVRSAVLALAGSTSDLQNPLFWTRIITQMMTMVNKLPREGAQKKALVTETLRLLIEREVPEADRQTVLALMDLFASPAIDLAVAFWHSAAPKVKSVLTCKPCRK